MLKLTGKCKALTCTDIWRYHQLGTTALLYLTINTYSALQAKCIQHMQAGKPDTESETIPKSYVMALHIACCPPLVLHKFNSESMTGRKSTTKHKPHEEQK